MAQQETDEETWWLTAALPPLKPDSKFELEFLREVKGEELEEARAANALLTRLASAAPYARLVELYQDLDQGRRREKASAKRKAADMNRAASALAKVAAAFPEEIVKHGREDFGEESEEVAELEAAVAEECGRATFRLLVEVGRLEQGPFAVDGEDVVNDAEAVTALAEEITEVTPAIDFVASLGSGVFVAQRLIGRQLEIYAERLNAATLSLRRLATEVFDGSPGLVRANLDTSDGKLNLGQMTPEPLALDGALYLQRALRHARALLAASGGTGVKTSPQDVPWADALSDASAMESRLLAEPPAPAGVAVEAAASEPADAPAQAEPPEPPAGDRADQVLDLRALAAHATELVDSIERVWSDALDPAALAAAQEEMGARFGSLLQSIQRRASASDRSLRAAGLDPTIPAFPLPPEELGRISLEPGTERRLRQLQLAEVEALMLLLAALEAMRAPSAHTIKLDTGEVESWWESGAFALVRARVRLLVRVSEEAAAAEVALIGGEAPATAPAFFDRLRLASDALGAGDVDGALLHAAIALRLRAAQEVDDVDQLPDDLYARLASDDRLAQEGVLLLRLEEAVATLGVRRPLDIGAAVLLAPRVIELVARLCLEMPEVIRDAVGGKHDALVGEGGHGGDGA